VGEGRETTGLVATTGVRPRCSVYFIVFIFSTLISLPCCLAFGPALGILEGGLLKDFISQSERRFEMPNLVTASCGSIFGIWSVGI